MSQFSARDMSLPTISALKRSELRTMTRFTSRHFPLGEARKKVTSGCRRLIRVRYGTTISSIPDKHFAEAYALIRAYCEFTLGKPLPEDACLRGIPADTRGMWKLLRAPASRRQSRAKKAAVKEAEKVADDSVEESIELPEGEVTLPADASDAETAEVKKAKDNYQDRKSVV